MRNAYCREMSKMIYVGEDLSHFKGAPIEEEEEAATADFAQENIIRCIRCSPDG